MIDVSSQDISRNKLHYRTSTGKTDNRIILFDVVFEQELDNELSELDDIEDPIPAVAEVAYGSH